MTREKGITLIEMVITIVLLGIIGIVTAEVFLYSTRSVLTGDAVREATQVNRLAVDRMTREIRNVRNNTCVAAAMPTTFSFIDSNNKTITYNLSAGSLVRTENGTPNTLVSNVTSLVFTYYDKSCGPDNICGNADDTAQPVDITAGPPATCTGANLCSATCPTPTNIWSVQIALTIGSGSEAVQFRSQVHPRGF